MLIFRFDPSHMPFLKTSEYIYICDEKDETQYYIWYRGQTYAGEETSVPVTVSEAHGYGMLITVCMADYDTQAQEIFDGMVWFYLAHLSSGLHGKW